MSGSSCDILFSPDPEAPTSNTPTQPAAIYGFLRSSLIMGVHPGCRVCSIVAASLVAVETDVGETISAAKVAFVCGLWSVRAVALLPAGPSSCFCIYQLLFPSLEVLVQGASPYHAVDCKVLSGIGVDVKCFHVSLAVILVAQLWAAFGFSPDPEAPTSNTPTQPAASTRETPELPRVFCWTQWIGVRSWTSSARRAT